MSTAKPSINSTAYTHLNFSYSLNLPSPLYKTEDVEPLKVIAICEYKNDESFQKCQKVFLKFLPKIQDLIIKTNFARAHVVEDVI